MTHSHIEVQPRTSSLSGGVGSVGWGSGAKLSPIAVSLFGIIGTILSG